MIGRTRVPLISQMRGCWQSSKLIKRRGRTNWRCTTIRERIEWLRMSKARPTVGIDGRPLPVLPPERDERVWAKLVRVLFYTPGFLAMLLFKTGEPEAFGITVELLMLSSAAAIVGGIFIGAQSSGAGADRSSQIGAWSG